ncbi:hypothetical protein J25TS5_10590 [Paenibacillus faecis]|uniref:DUF3221 domain-containing protein n=1 Tax=Paenibacillus faecis TaxID=862114 RepID=UPI001B14F97D|nr:DUF3221 domain-containing protein [Paenibacillus faecis]GIO84127.1 hypothetical protein J25TS5_10590 [Paenibacillus faecis]
MVQKTSAVMKWALVFILMLLFPACNTEDEVLKGTVHTVDAENKRILVISQLKEADLNKDYEEVLGSNAYSQAVWVNTVTPSKYKKGDEIEVFYEVSNDSFPAQVTAKKMVRIKK